MLFRSCMEALHMVIAFSNMVAVMEWTRLDREGRGKIGFTLENSQAA